MTRFRQIPFTPDPSAPAQVSAPLGFVHRLRQRLAAEKVPQLHLHCAAVVLEENALCWLNIEQNLVMVSEPAGIALKQLELALGTKPDRLSLEPLARDAFDMQSRYTRTTPMRPLLWQAGLNVLEGGAPMPPLSPDSCLQLRRWPDFRVLAHRHDDFRICALLIKRGLTVQGACEALNLPQSQVQAFFNAAYLSGYAVPVLGTDAPKVPPKAGRLATLWRDVRSRWSQ
jgi:hypothetical protein